VQGDAIRNISGEVTVFGYKDYAASDSFAIASKGMVINLFNSPGGDFGDLVIQLHAYRTVPIGAENSVRTLSDRFWRRVA
jgi:hypothetical protein